MKLDARAYIYIAMFIIIPIASLFFTYDITIPPITVIISRIILIILFLIAMYCVCVIIAMLVGDLKLITKVKVIITAGV